MCVLAISCHRVEEPKEIVEELRYCESVLPYRDGLLIANFGSSSLDPLNQEGKGYIVWYESGRSVVMIPADGHLSAPKGMSLKDDFLFIADVNKIVVYNLNALDFPPQEVVFPEPDMYVNHLLIVGDMLLASVTNTGNIYALDVSNPASVSRETLAVYAMVPGANGLFQSDYHLFIASYPPDGVVEEDNVIYMIEEMGTPRSVRLTHQAAMYDGLVTSQDKSKLYFTDWQSKGVGCLDFSTGEITYLPLESPIEGPAQLCRVGDRLYVPDLVNSKVHIITL